jgi:hypothetical protein
VNDSVIFAHLWRHPECKALQAQLQSAPFGEAEHIFPYGNGVEAVTEGQIDLYNKPSLSGFTF